MMRITFVLNALARGGARVIFEYAHHLQRRGHDVNIVYPAVLPLSSRLSLLGLAVWILPSIRYATQQLRWHPNDSFWLDVPLVKVLALHPRLARRLEKQIPDADVIIATAWSTAYTVNALSARKGCKWYFIQSYEIWDLWDESTCWKEAQRLRRDDEPCALAMARVVPRNKGFRTFKEQVDRSYRLPLHKITISAWLRRLVHDHFGERVEGEIPNAVDFNVFFDDGSRPDPRERFTVLLPYSTRRAKGFLDGLKACELVRARRPRVRFAAFGRRPLFNVGVRSLPSWLSFYEPTSDAHLRSLYNEAHIFIDPSWMEGFSLTPMEAMACGCAVVTTNASGFAEYLTDDVNARVVPIKDPEALAQCICRLVDDEDERRRLAEDGSHFVKRFTWETATDRLETLLTGGASEGAGASARNPSHPVT